MSFSPVRLDGGGCCNVHALSPDRSRLLAGADTQGFYLTSTSPLGNHWTVQNRGIGASQFYRQCAALLWSTTETSPQVAYALTGETGTGGGLLAGTLGADGNLSWRLRSGVPQGAGNHRGAAPAGLPNNGWQRSTGRLLYQDSLYLFAATYNQGILRSSNTGGTGVAGSDDFPVACTMAGAVPGTGNWFATAICPDPNVSTTLYASFYDSAGAAAGLWKTTTAHGATPNFTAVSMTGGPAGGIEDIFLVGQYLYCAAGSSGIWRYGPLNGTPAWAGLNGASVDTASTNWWSTVTGYVDGSSNHVVIIGDSNPSTMSKTLMQLTVPSNYPTGSITYANLTGSVQVTNVPAASGSYPWWIPAAGLHVYLGGGGYICPMVTVDASNLASVNLYCAGSGGAYRSIAGGGWTVADSGMPMFLAHPVAANPVHAGHVVWGDSDWCLFDDSKGDGTEDAASLVNDPPVSSTEGWAVAISPDGNTVYASQGGKYTNSGGEAWSRPWNQPANWASLGLRAHTGGNVAIGMCALTDAGANVLLAAVWGSGMWRYAPDPVTGAYAWTRVNATILTTLNARGNTTGNQCPITYDAANNLLACYDRLKGVWRSGDKGRTWALVWARVTNDSLSGTAAFNPAVPGELWVSASGTLYKITGADAGTVTGGGLTPQAVTSLPGTAGPLGFSAAGTLYVATQDTGTGSGLWQYAPAAGTWADVAGDNTFACCNANPEFISVGGNGRVYVSGSNVVAQGIPSGGGPPPGTSAPFTEVQVSGNILGASGQLNLWFSEAGGTPSKLGTLLIARIQTTDGTATITAPPGWVLALDEAAQAGGGTARVLTYHYLNNPGGIGSPAASPVTAPPALRRAAALTAAPAILPGAVTGGGRLTDRAAVSGPRIIGGPAMAPGDGLALFTSSNTGATIKGKIAEYSTPPGTVQFFDQAGTAGAQASATSLPVTAAAANACTGGLGVANFAANWTVAGSGQSWTLPAGWTGDGTVNNLTLTFAIYYNAALTAGPTSVTGTISPGTGGTMAAWAAGLATYYALAASPVTITTASCPNGTVAVAYGPAGAGVTIRASGGATPYSFAQTAGTLPPGLSLSSAGALSGTPTTGGTYSFSVTVTDAAAQTAVAAYTVTIAAALTVTTSSLPGGTAGTAYGPGGAGVALAASGGISPYAWAVTAGSPPPGLALDAGGTIRGTPLLPGTYSFTVQVTDHAGATATAALSVTVAAGPLSVSTQALAAASLGVPYTAALAASGGTPPYTWTVT